MTKTLSRSRRKPAREGAENARNQLPAILSAAENGRATVITRHGRAIAAVVPMDRFAANDGDEPQRSLLVLKGTGRGLWGKDSIRTLRGLREEWSH